MKKVRKITALFLCILMMFPAQTMTIFADTEQPQAAVSAEEATTIETAEEEAAAAGGAAGEETLAVERIEETLEVEALEEETIDPAEERIEESLPIEPLTVWDEEAMIYWNPGGMLPEELASASNASQATASNARKGSDSADGLSPERPVKTLARAVEQAEKMQEELGVEASEITIYAMNPMEIGDGQLYVLNGANIRIASWPGRSYDNDTIFYLTGGQLTLTNTLLESGSQAADPEETQLVTVYGGTLQLGQSVEINGQIAMDYREVTEDEWWELATDSNLATGSNAVTTKSEGGATDSFNIDDYILSTDAESAELIVDNTTASTWCAPVIELLQDYQQTGGEYLLEVRTDAGSDQLELVRTLYADELSGEEFMDFFAVTYMGEDGTEWNLIAETTEAATIRDTESADTVLYQSLMQMIAPAADEETTSISVATAKSLVAARAGSGLEIYWNPGGQLVVSGVTYPAGSDTGYDGTTPEAPVKSWAMAVQKANGGTIICMQSVTVGAGAVQYIGNAQTDGSYLIESESLAKLVTLKIWEAQPQPAFIVPSGETLAFKNIELLGIDKQGTAVSTQTVLCQSGDIVIEENVTAETGYIQVNAFSGLAAHPVTVNSIAGEAEGIITLLFGGINNNLSYRFTDVVVPGTALDTEVALDADAVGQALLARFVLETSNRHSIYGGQSNFDWKLRQDTAEDDPVANPQNLELYADYYFDAVYLDGVRGDDSYFGATCQFPVKTWAAAYGIWSAEIDRSIAARTAALAEGFTAADIEANFPVPTVIYICGMVSVEDTENWHLETKTDYDGTILTTEVRSHMDIPDDDNGDPVHLLPQILVEVNSGGVLTIKDVTFRNFTDEKDSITLQANIGGVLTVTGDTLLTGERLEADGGLITYQEVTAGTNVQVTAGGRFVMDTGWNGAIECREHGVEGVGNSANITMNAGAIRKNNSFDQELYEAQNENQIKGAGVVLSNGAAFEMNGGMITQNTVYQYGAGVYLTGNGTSFTLNKGEISENKMAGYLRYEGAGSSSTSDVQGFGIGIYAGTGTEVTLGTSTSDVADTLVTRNMGYWADGIGVWTDGTLNVGKAAISVNYNSTGGYTANVRKGLGLYAAKNAKVTMDGAAVEGNCSANTGYFGNAQGAGMYLEYNTNGNVIKNSSISRNIIGHENTNSLTYTAGGGIYLAGGVLSIDNSVIEENEALYGGGIMVYTTSTAQLITLTAAGTSISNNKARFERASSNYGYGGGIYAYGYGTIDLGTGTKVYDNESSSQGGGMYLNGISYSSRLTLKMTGTEVNLNKSYSSGAGIYANYHTDIEANTVELKENTSEKGYGGAIYAYGYSSSSYTTKLFFTDVNIELNNAYSGAGIYSSYTYLYFNRVDIVNNTATYGIGGGIYDSNYTFMYFLEVNIIDNKAVSGNAGGCYLSSGTYYWTDTKVSDNKASEASGYGGGIYLNSGTMYFTENTAGASSLTENSAVRGGGLYSVSGSISLDIDGEFQNTATEQGSNLYLGYGNNYIYKGVFKQPSSQYSDVYNIYLNVTSSTSHALTMDPQSVEIEKKNGSEPDAIYLNTTNSFLSYIKVPPSDTFGVLPIDVNTDVFKIGSIVVKPAATSIRSLYRVIIGTTGYADSISSYNHGAATLENAADNINYSSGGTLPKRTQLGGYNNNIVIVGEGVYLSGSGNDNNGGTSPDDAVASFAKAKQILEQRIYETKAADDLETDPEQQIGFSPFIYICGNVLISSDETWELDYDNSIFSVTNENYLTAEGDDAYDAQIRRFASFVSQPMITVGATSTDEIEFTTDKIIIDGMADAVVIADQSGNSPVIKVMNQSKATLTGYSRITNNYYNGVDVYGSLVLTGNAADENKQLVDHHGYYVRILASTGSLEMNGYARIVAEKNVSQIGSMTCSGVYSEYTNVEFVMKENSSIARITTGTVTGNLMSRGIYMTGQQSKVQMQDFASISNTSNYGVYMSGTSASLTMEDSASISGSSYGVYMYGINSSLSMNKNAAALDSDSAQIIGNYGVYIARYGIQIEMGKKALISGSGTRTGYGIFVASSTSINTQSTLIMDDNARITNCNTGIYINRMDSPLYITMNDKAAIEQNGYGIFEYAYSSYQTYGIARFSLEMGGTSRISGNVYNGIRLLGYKSFTTDSYHNITLKDNAIIGGTTVHNISNAASGNGYTGIYANSPINLEMSGSSKISGNGTSEGASNYTLTNAISLTPYNYSGSQSDLRATQTAHITLRENASICDNKGGIYVHKDSTYPLNPCEITLDGSGGTPSIQGNTDAVYLKGTDQTIKLQGTAILGAATQSGADLALDCYGSLELDGRSQINALTYLYTSVLPITMTHKVEDPTREYRLWLAEGFLGQIVVQPDDPDNQNGGVTDVTDQLSYFTKAGAEGTAANKSLAAAAPNIILEGENNVYLSGTGVDTNTGNSPSTAVRTFKRAKELLEGAGYYTSGANIVICKTTEVLAEDEDWSFDSNGTVTNSQSGDTWTPVVSRYETYTTGRMISIPDGTSTTYASTVTFKNITIDGGSEEGIAVSSTDAGILYVGYGRTAVLSDGAVLQNNKYTGSTIADKVCMGVLVYGGSLEINGGIIQNIVISSSVSNATSYTMASAVYCYDYSILYPGTVTMKTGKVSNNTIDVPNQSGNLRAGAVSVEGQYAVFEMSGGQITDNEVSVQSGYSTSRPSYGAGLVSYNATSTISGGIIRGNRGVLGSAIYYYGSQNGVGSMILSGGQITGNTTNETVDMAVQNSEGIYCPVFVAGWDFQLSGGGADIQDNIYLNSINNIIKVSANIYHTGRIYNLFLNHAASSSDGTKFQKGSAVVQPDGIWITDVTPYLAYFRVHSNPYILDCGKTSRTTGTVSGVKENQCLILMHAVFLDSDSGNDNNDGTTPGLAVKTFTRAQAVGRAGIGSSEMSEYFVIYISGKATNTAAESIWTLPEPSYMIRYTGFQIYNPDGSQVDKLFYPYHGYLIEPSYDLTLDGITVYGRRSIDTIINNGESLVYVKDGITVTVQTSGAESTVLGRNYNQGEYSNPYNGENESLENLSSKGGAFYVEAGGVLQMLGGTISDMTASYGSAVYLEADETDALKFGHLYLSGSPSITGTVYLSGTGSTTSAYIQPDGSYLPTAALNIVIGNDYDGRPVVSYTDSTIPGYNEKEYFNMEDSIKALYDVVNNSANNSILELEIRKALYLDGQNGDDISGDGKTPETAFKTIKQVYQTIADEAAAEGAVEGTLVFVVNTVEFSAAEVTLNNILIRNLDGTSSYAGSYEDDTGAAIDITGQVYFKRYAQPDGYDSSNSEYYGYNRPTLMDTLFLVENDGELTLNGIYLDGHSQPSEGADKRLVAAGVEATSPLVTVMAGGILKCKMKVTSSVTNGVDTATVLTNNVNINQKSNIIGTIDGSNIIEGSSAGIELLGGTGGSNTDPVGAGSTNGGKAVLERTQFSNLSLGSNVVSGGTDVYSFGDLHFSNLTFFSGTVFLEGFGVSKTESTYETSHFLTVDLYGQPAQTDFQVLMRDPYNGRTVVFYEPEENRDVGPAATQIGRYRLEERVKEFFYLNKRQGAPYVLELQVPVAVYIDGINGDDDVNSLDAGSTPSTPVKTLKRAYELLYTRSGNTIYVVGPILITDATYATGTTYTGVNGTIALGSTDKVKITRYIQPDFAYNASTPEEIAEVEAAGYDVADYQGELLYVKDGATASFGTNVYFDGHRNPKNDVDYPLAATVSRTDVESKAPMIIVEKGGTLNLYSGTTLLDNNNTFDEVNDAALQADGIDEGIHYGHGGVLYNSGTAIVDGALFESNEAQKGSGVYQDGTFTINSAPENLAYHGFYLTTENTGTESNPVWGTDHIIRTQVAIPDNQTFEVEMDNAVKGRDVVKFLDSTAYDPDVDAEHEHFILGSTVPEYLFLVEAVNDETVLELQNWEILDVSVPSDIYLVIHRSGSLDTTTKLSSVQEDAPGTDLLTTPEYTITNNGRYDVKVSVIAFENQNDESGITAIGHMPMTLVDAPMNIFTDTDLYLAIMGLDGGGSGLTMAETSLKPYGEAPVTEAPAVLGMLESQTEGNFMFVGAVGTGFIERYNDSTFPVSGSTRTEVQAYMDGTSPSGYINARAKYALKFKLEIDPSRRSTNP